MLFCLLSTSQMCITNVQPGSIYNALPDEYRRIFFLVAIGYLHFQECLNWEQNLKYISNSSLTSVTHISAQPFPTTYSHPVKIYLMCQKHGDNGNLTDFWICYSDETRQYAETSPSTYREGDGMIQLNSICVTITWVFYIKSELFT